MPSSIPDIFIKYGTKQTLTVITPFVINNPNKIYFIYKGSISLSSSRFSHGEPSGKLYNFKLFYQNDIFFGFEQKTKDDLVFIADAEENSTVYELLLPFLINEINADKTLESQLIPYLNQWITNIYFAISEDTTIQSPPSKKTLKVGEVSQIDANEFISIDKDVAWIETDKIDNFLFNSHINIPPQTKTLFPITKKALLKTKTKVEVAIKSSEYAIADSTLWSSLELLHSLVLQSDLFEAEQYHAISETWLKKKYKTLENELQTSLVNADHNIPIEDKLNVDNKYGHIDHKLFKTFALVAAQSDIDIVLPPNINETTDPISEICRCSGIRYREILLEGEWQKQTGTGSFLGFLKQTNEPLAIIPKKMGFEAINLSSNSKFLINNRSKELVSKVCYSFYKPLPKRILKAKDLLNFAFSKNKNDINRLIITGVFTALMALVLPILTAVLFDEIIPNAQRSQLLHISYALLMATAGGVFFQASKYIAILRLKGIVNSNLQVAIWDRLLELPTEFFRKYTAGDLAERSIGVTHMLNTLSSVTINSIVGGVFSAINFSLLFYFSKTLGLIALLLTLVIVLVMYILGRKQVLLQKEVLSKEGEISGLVLQLLSGVSVLKVTGNETKGFIQWFNKFVKIQKLSLVVMRIQNTQRIFTSFIYLIAIAFIYLAAIKLSDNFSTGAFLSFNAAFGAFFIAMLELSGGLISALKIIPIYNRMKPIIEEIPENTEVKETPHNLKGELELNNILFRYDQSSPYILKNISLTINKDEFVALVGPSGSGKSTIIRLLLGFNQAEVGTILYDGRDLKNIDLKLLRKQIGVVLQDGSLIAGDIYTNIVGSSVSLTLQDAWDAAKAAAFDKEIEEMPMGMFTIVNNEGGTLSGGQKQRLMIARALVNKPKILIFDEATSALDNRTQAIVTESLNKLQITKIVVAHRLSTIINADKICYLENGQILEVGTYKELMKQKGKFYNLAERQIE